MASCSFDCRRIFNDSENKPLKYLFFALFLADVGVHMYACFPPEKHPLRRVTKCLLMPLLLCCYYLLASPPSSLVMLALFFGFLGDVFLLVPERSWSFVSGLISFAIGHVFYITAVFSNFNTATPGWLIPVAAVIYLAGMARMFAILWPRMPKMMFIPCLLYMLIISFMSLCMLAFALTYSTPTAWCAYIGSIFFIASDSVLALVTFKRRIPFRHVIVMSTYIIAQTLLAIGLAFPQGW